MTGKRKRRPAERGRGRRGPDCHSRLQRSEIAAALVRALNAEVPGCDVVVIDDGSSDNTREMLKGLARAVDAALQSGHRRRGANGLADRVARELRLRHAAGWRRATSAERNPKLLEAMRESCGRPGRRFAFPQRRRIQIHGHAAHGHSLFCADALGHLRHEDHRPDFRIPHREPAGIRLLAHRYSEDFPEVEALVVAHRAGLEILEVPVVMAERSAGRSSIGAIKSLVYMLKVPLAIFMNLLRKPEVNF